MTTSCDDIRVEEALLGLLDAGEREAVDRHLASCAACSASADQARELLSRLDALPQSVPVTESFVQRAVARTRRPSRHLVEGILMVTAASLMLCWLAYLHLGTPVQDPAPAKQDAPHAKEIDQIVDKLRDPDIAERDRAEKAIAALARDLEHALAALEKSRASSDEEFKQRATRATTALLADIERVRAKALAKFRPDEPAASRSREDLLKALADATVKLEKDPTVVDAWLNRAHLRLLLNDTAAAAADAEEALRRDPKCTRAFILRGRVHLMRKEFQAAVADFTRTIELDPRSVEAHGSRGEAFIRLARFEDALKDCTRAIELDPTASDLYHNRGTARRMMGQFDGATADFEEAARLREKHKK